MRLNGRGRYKNFKDGGGLQMQGLTELWYLWGEGCLRDVPPGKWRKNVIFRVILHDLVHSFLPKVPTQNQLPYRCIFFWGGVTACVHFEFATEWRPSRYIDIPFYRFHFCTPSSFSFSLFFSFPLFFFSFLSISLSLSLSSFPFLFLLF